MRSARTLPFALVATLTLTLSACGEDGVEPEQESPTPIGVVDETPDDDAGDDDDATTDDDDTGDDTAGAGGENADTTDDGTATAGTAALTVSAEGQDMLVLRLDDDGTFDGVDEDLEGLLISGPGGCLAVQPNGQPQLLIFGADAVLAPDPPRVSLAGAETELGEPLAVEAAPVLLEDVEGVPDRCRDGAAETAWVVEED